jgi:hypothetical protein
MDSQDVAPMVVMIVIALSIAAIIILRGPVGKAIARKLEGGSLPNEDLKRRLEDMEARLVQTEMMHNRVEELEERVDFTERVLSREKPRAQIESGDRS